MSRYDKVSVPGVIPFISLKMDDPSYICFIFQLIASLCPLCHIPTMNISLLHSNLGLINQGMCGLMGQFLSLPI